MTGATCGAGPVNTSRAPELISGV